MSNRNAVGIKSVRLVVESEKTRVLRSPVRIGRHGQDEPGDRYANPALWAAPGARGGDWRDGRGG